MEMGKEKPRLMVARGRRGSWQNLDRKWKFANEEEEEWEGRGSKCGETMGISGRATCKKGWIECSASPRQILILFLSIRGRDSGTRLLIENGGEAENLKIWGRNE
jgi:hypothetical protein